MVRRRGTEVERPEHSGPGRAGDKDAGRSLDQLAGTCRPLGNPLRARLIDLLGASPLGGADVCDLASQLKRAQSTISHHLGVLAKAGIVTNEQNGTWTWYRVVPEKLSELREQLSSLVGTAVIAAEGALAHGRSAALFN
jgi:ArsR family transcriptional regulator